MSIPVVRALLPHDGPLDEFTMVARANDLLAVSHIPARFHLEHDEDARWLSLRADGDDETPPPAFTAGPVPGENPDQVWGHDSC